MVAHLLWECRSEFDQFLLELAPTMVSEIALDNAKEIIDSIFDVLSFGMALLVKINDDMCLVPVNWIDSKRDILGWRNNDYDGLPKAINGSAMRYKLSITDAQNKKLTRLLHQYASHNKKFTLRKMNECIKPHEFFYIAKPTTKRQEEAV